MKKITILLVSIIFWIGVKAQNENAHDTIQAITITQNQLAEKTYNQGVELYKSGQMNAALTKFEESITIKPNFDLAYLNKANILLNLGKYEEAYQSYTHCIQINKNPKAYYGRGMSSYYLAKYKDAGDDFEIVLKFPNSEITTDAHYYYGNALFEQQYYNKAIEEYNKVIEIRPNYANVYNERGSSYKMMNRAKEAIADYETAIRLDSNFVYAYNNLGSTKKNQKDEEGAMAAFNKAIELKPDYYVAINNRGDLYMILEKYDMALQDFNQAISLKKDYAFAYNNRGNVYYKQRNYQQAIIDYNTAIALDSNYGVAYLNRGISKEMLRDGTGACEDWAKAAELHIQSANVYLQNQCNKQ